MNLWGKVNQDITFNRMVATAMFAVGFAFGWYYHNAPLFSGKLIHEHVVYVPVEKEKVVTKFVKEPIGPYEQLVKNSLASALEFQR